MSTEKQLYTISVYTENNIGLLSRIAGIFSRRHINIESLTTSQSEIEGVFRFVIAVEMTEVAVQKIVGQIEKQVEVIKAFYDTDAAIIHQESAMFKINNSALEAVNPIIKEAGAELVAQESDFFVVALTGNRQATEKLRKDLASYGLLQFVRSGRICVTKEPMPVSELLTAFDKA